MDFKLTNTQINNFVECWGNKFYQKVLDDIKTYSEKWKLTDITFHEYYSINAIFFCKSKIYGDCVLKLGGNDQDTEFVGEYNVLREYDGRKYVKVYECDIHIASRKKAMLIERCIPGIMLSKEPSLEKRLEVFSRLYSGLHIKPGNPEIYPSYTKWICDTAKKCTNTTRDLKGLDAHMKNAEKIYLEICEKYNRQMLLHIDIFGANIVSVNDGYKLIDPKGVTGDPIFETGQFIFAECCEDSLQPENAEIMFNYLEKSIGIPNEILRQCFYIETIRFLCYEGVIPDGVSDWDVERANFAYGLTP
ncbi:MAG: hypothetical protein FWC32_12410 [Firmicutes bacterium]|nr:hypothetical protein [Bacillota bacterium]